MAMPAAAQDMQTPRAVVDVISEQISSMARVQDLHAERVAHCELQYADLRAATDTALQSLDNKINDNSTSIVDAQRSIEMLKHELEKTREAQADRHTRDIRHG